MVRTEVRSTDAGSNLGHVFDDGPFETSRLGYCINFAALRFIPIDEFGSEGYGEFLKLLENQTRS
jgi:peptide methionine sulfoxide reductase MsrB